jgi:hypothetical protein
MAPKSSSGTGKEKKIISNEEDDVLQAVILADSFNKRFKPLTTQRPRVCDLFHPIHLKFIVRQCLLPICNAPLLEWTFEGLALAGVQEIFVVCRSQTQLIKAAIRYVTHFHWTPRTNCLTPRNQRLEMVETKLGTQDRAHHDRKGDVLGR